MCEPCAPKFEVFKSGDVTSPNEILSECRHQMFTVGLDEKVICANCGIEFHGLTVTFQDAN